MEAEEKVDEKLTMIGIDPAVRDRLKECAAKIRKSMRNIVEGLIEEYLKANNG